MNKKILIAALVTGILLTITAVVISVASASGANIIGGVGWPTFAFYFGKTAWLATVGACVSIASGVMLAVRRK